MSSFSAALTDADLPVPDGVVGPDGKPAPKRFNVYRNNVIVSLTEALAQTYPAIERLLGEDYFKALARSFVTEHPPTSPVLLWYGAEFPDFIETFPPLRHYPYLADVARLEWAWLQAYHAEDAEPLDPQVLGSVSPERVADVRFTIHPAASCISSRWPVFSIALANRFCLEDPPAIDLEQSESVLVARPDLEVGLHPMRPGADLFFRALETHTLQEAANKALAEISEFDLSGCLSDFLSVGAFSGLGPVGAPADRST
ncbi:DNA-binding domain-containing protein [Roseibium aggregatum]|uniref:DUF2063 domain-containing protein n=1 Tax=Roseibium aggregatum TaxID=187304 RepID=A0A926NW14_9HYPH|nr:DNA-binding domain-containing protein [Roseibium aggregatum]MBD1548427.1 DUF2063 domain-containing protein [Roseibium aggregatum]